MIEKLFRHKGSGYAYAVLDSVASPLGREYTLLSLWDGWETRVRQETPYTIIDIGDLTPSEKAQLKAYLTNKSVSINWWLNRL